MDSTETLTLCSLNFTAWVISCPVVCGIEHQELMFALTKQLVLVYQHHQTLTDIEIMPHAHRLTQTDE